MLLITSKQSDSVTNEEEKKIINEHTCTLSHYCVGQADIAQQKTIWPVGCGSSQVG